MTWKSRILILLILAIPAFTGFPVLMFDKEVVPGATYGWIGYFLIVNTALCGFSGAHVYGVILSITALVSVPVVFAGGTISFLFMVLFSKGSQAEYSAHYLSLCITMLTVIPLSLALIVGITVLVLGYFLFEAVIYPLIGKVIPFFLVTDAKAALAEIPPNLLQGVLSAIIAFGIYKVFHRKS